MNAIIKQIQDALEYGRPADFKTGPLATQVIKEIQQCTRTLEKQTRTLEKDPLKENLK